MAALLLALALSSVPEAQANDWTTGVTYEYDAAGNIRRIGTDSHVYDAAGRLVQSDTNGVRRNYSYDAFGNRLTCSQPGTDCQSAVGIDPATNRLEGVEYDDRGNLIRDPLHEYTYDGLGMQTRAVTGSGAGAVIREYIYTADDERIAVYTPTQASWRWTVRDGSGKVLREMTSQDPASGALGSAGWTWVKDYVYRDGLLLASKQMDPVTATVSTYRYHLDHLGTPRRITDPANTIVGQHTYHAFGPELPDGAINEPSRTPLKYTGHERDGDLDYMHARYYDLAMGRFLSVDPFLNVKKATQNPQKWNRYSYVRNNPINAIDPDGKDDLFIGEDFKEPFFPATRTHRATIDQATTSVGVSFIPGYGDLYDAISAARGHDLLTGEKLGTFARIAGIVLPFVGVGALNKATDIFRGGDSLVATAKDVKIIDGLVQPTHGVSVNTVAGDMAKFGGAYRITAVPDGLQIIQRGKNANHYEIVPKKAMAMEEYQKLLSQVKLEPVK